MPAGRAIIFAGVYLPPSRSMNTKYTFTDETKTVSGHQLHRIRALRDIGIHAPARQLGGWIESEKNLSTSGDAWVADEAEVFGEAQVFGDALIFGKANVTGSARVSGNARVGDSAWVSDQASVSDDALISGKARVAGRARISESAWVGDHAWIGGTVRTSGWPILSIVDSEDSGDSPL